MRKYYILSEFGFDESRGHEIKFFDTEKEAKDYFFKIRRSFNKLDEETFDVIHTFKRSTDFLELHAKIGDEVAFERHKLLEMPLIKVSGYIATDIIKEGERETLITFTSNNNAIEAVFLDHTLQYKARTTGINKKKFEIVEDNDTSFEYISTEDVEFDSLRMEKKFL